jgi:hypothetical protein
MQPGKTVKSEHIRKHTFKNACKLSVTKGTALAEKNLPTIKSLIPAQNIPSTLGLFL